MLLETIQNTYEYVKIIQKSHDEILHVQKIDSKDFNTNSIGWCSDKNIELLKSIQSGTVIISFSAFEILNEYLAASKINLILTENPRLFFSTLLSNFFVPKRKYGVIHSSAVIDSSVIYNSKEVIIEPNVVIESNVVIGKDVIIGANTIIKADTIISSNVKIGSNCTIGGVGFGYEKNENGEYEVIPHIGNVVLKDCVEIGNNTCIDRAVIGSTILHKNVKVDNLVHIAHGVEVGENSLIIAHAMIAGSVKIGTNSWIAPSSSIRQKLIIGNNVTVGMGSVVVKNVLDDDIVAGVPAKKIN